MKINTLFIMISLICAHEFSAMESNSAKSAASEFNPQMVGTSQHVQGRDRQASVAISEDILEPEKTTKQDAMTEEQKVLYQRAYRSNFRRPYTDRSQYNALSNATSTPTLFPLTPSIERPIDTLNLRRRTYMTETPR